MATDMPALPRPGWRIPASFGAIARTRGARRGRNYTAACKDYQENTWVGVSSTITESDSPSAASRGYCRYFA